MRYLALALSPQPSPSPPFTSLTALSLWLSPSPYPAFSEVFQSLKLTAYDLSIDTLDMHAHDTFHRYVRACVRE